MNMIYLTLAFSAVLWFLIDRFKPLWAPYSFGKWITLAASAVGAFGLAFGFKLDLIQGFALSEAITPIGIVLTALIIMSGSSATAEIIEKIKGGNGAETFKNILEDLGNPEG